MELFLVCPSEFAAVTLLIKTDWRDVGGRGVTSTSALIRRGAPIPESSVLLSETLVDGDLNTVRADKLLHTPLCTGGAMMAPPAGKFIAFDMTAH